MPHKILYICPNSERAGAEQVTRLAVRHHDLTRWQPEMFFFRDGPLVREMRADGIVCHVCPESVRMRLRNPKSIFRMAEQISRVVSERRVDLIHSVMGYTHLVGGIASWKTKVPEVWYQHGPTGSLDWLTGLVPSRAVLVNSVFTLQKEIFYRPSTERLKIIYPGIEEVSPESLHEKSKSLRLANNWASDETVFILVGRISPMKGQLTFLNAAQILLRQVKQCRFVLLGSTYGGQHSEYAQKVLKLAASPELAPFVQCMDYQADPLPIMQASDVLVNSSDSPEPFGMTLLEAMMLEKPVIAPDQGGPLEIFTDQREGLFFSHGNASDLASKMANLEKNPKRRIEMGKLARAKVLNSFRVARMINELEFEYDQAIERNSFS